MKKLLLLGACLLTLTCFSPAAHAAPPDVVVVRVQEAFSKITVAIARNGRAEEVVEFDNGIGEKNLKAATTGYQRVIQQLYQEGYALQSTFTAGAGAHVTLVFVKGS